MSNTKLKIFTDNVATTYKQLFPKQTNSLLMSASILYRILFPCAPISSEPSSALASMLPSSQPEHAKSDPSAPSPPAPAATLSDVTLTTHGASYLEQTLLRMAGIDYEVENVPYAGCSDGPHPRVVGVLNLNGEEKEKKRMMAGAYAVGEDVAKCICCYSGNDKLKMEGAGDDVA
mmetsp:Transcript_202/g.438  ORF Transcript_202/g.438 Transcript_202/m.438 type:complete len:175 (+) Transcript_202:131-655(+)